MHYYTSTNMYPHKIIHLNRYTETHTIIHSLICSRVDTAKIIWEYEWLHNTKNSQEIRCSLYLIVEVSKYVWKIYYFGGQGFFVNQDFAIVNSRYDGKLRKVLKTQVGKGNKR